MSAPRNPAGSVIELLAAAGYDWQAYDVRGIVDECQTCLGAEPAAVDDLDLLDIAGRHWRDLSGRDVPCPAWCRLEHGHPYSADGEGLARVHRATLAECDRLAVDLQMASWEDRCPDGSSTVEPPGIHLAVDGDYTPAQLRQVAALLINGADTADQVLAGHPRGAQR